MQVTWIVHCNILGNEADKFCRTIVEQGHQVIPITWRLFDDIKIDLEPKNCAVIYGSTSFIRKIPKFVPGAYGFYNSECTHYYHRLPPNILLNSRHVFTTWKSFYTQKDFWFEIFGDPIFIRPNSGHKTFTGQSVRKVDFDDVVSSLNQISSVIDDTLIVVTSHQNIIREFRFVIAKGSVVTGSEYSWGDDVTNPTNIPSECLEMARLVAGHSWQLDSCYVCDVGMTDLGPKLIELNSFSCAGLYHCDINQVIHSISDAAQQDWLDYYHP